MNLLTETINVLEEHGRTPEDVCYVANNTQYTYWDTFALLANFEYNNGHGPTVIADDLVIVGPDFWLARHEYDGSEWWEFKQAPRRPSIIASTDDFNLCNTF